MARERLEIIVDIKGAPKAKRDFKGLSDAEKQVTRQTKKMDEQFGRFRVNTSGVTRAVGAFRNKLLLVSFAVAIATTTLGKLTKAAGDAQEIVSKFEAVFKDQAKASRVFAQDLADAVGRSETEMLSFLATLQDTFVPMGFARDKAAELSEQLVTLAIDVASFNDKADADVIRDFQSALVGSTETVRKYGIVITEAGLKQEALDSGLIKTARTLTEQEKIQIRFNLIMKGTTDAQGDAVRTMDSFNNQMKKAQSAAKDFAIELGNRLLPAVTDLVSGFTNLVTVLKEWVAVEKAVSQEVKDQDKLIRIRNKLREDSEEAIVRLTERNKELFTLMATNTSMIERHGDASGKAADKLKRFSEEVAANNKAIDTAQRILASLNEILEKTTEKTDNLTRSIKDQIEGWAEMFREMRAGASALPDVSKAMRDTERRIHFLNSEFKKGKTAADDFADSLRDLSDAASALGAIGGLLERFGGKKESKLGEKASAFGQAATVVLGLFRLFRLASGDPTAIVAAHGAQFTVGGTGGTDSQFIPIKATPGERITIETPAQQRASGPQTIIIQIAGRTVATVLAPDLVRAAKLGQNELVIQA